MCCFNVNSQTAESEETLVVCEAIFVFEEVSNHRSESERQGKKKGKKESRCKDGYHWVLNCTDYLISWLCSEYQ